jgi:hypothetical protein
MLAWDLLNDPEAQPEQNSMNLIRCCSVDVAHNLLMLNMPGLDKWLESLNLKSLYELFAENGYDEMEQLLHLMHTPWEITSEDLISIGILKPGYRHRILSKLKEDSWGLSKKTLSSERKSIREKPALATSELCDII